MSKKEKQLKDPKAPKVKKTRAQKKAEKKAQKDAILPIHKRPIVCPPDKAGRHPAFRLGGYICRALVIWLAVAGLTMFVSDAMDYGVGKGFILGFSLLVVALCALAAHGKIEAAGAAAAAAGLAAWRVAVNTKLITDVFWSLLAMYNGCLERLYRIGYLSYVNYEANIGSSTPNEELLKIGVGVLIFLFGTVFTFCLVRRVRLVPPAVISTTFLVVILTFNIYANRFSNAGIVLVIITFAALLVMAAYDRQYRVKDVKRYDTELSLFGDSDRPALPEAYEKELAEKAARKKAKKAKRSKKHADAPLTVNEELTDYFAAKPQKKKKTEKKKLTPAEAAAAKAEKRELKKQIKAVKTYDRVTEQSRSAMGGFMSAAALLIAGLAILLPAVLVSGNFTTIEAIDEKMAYARDYVTAVLRGDDTTLDELEYQADGDKFKDHSTTLEQLEFTGRQIFHVTARYNTDYYMTGWIATDYDGTTGAWKAVSDEQLALYRDHFGLTDSPAENVRYNLYHYTMPSLVDDPEYTQNLTTKYKSNINYGFVNVLVSSRRVNSPGSECYLPANFAYPFVLNDYISEQPSALTYVNYFDGIRTGRKFDDNKAQYGSYTYAPIMTNADWAPNTAALTAAWQAGSEAVLIRDAIKGLALTADNANESPLTLSTYDEKNGTTMFSFTLKSRKAEQSWKFWHPTKNVKKAGGAYTIDTEAGVLTIFFKNSNVYDVTLEGYATHDAENLLVRYESMMTDEERAQLMDDIRLGLDYSEFAYTTYLRKSENPRIAQLAQDIAGQAHVEIANEVVKHWEDDPETEEDESLETYTEIEWENKAADVSLANQRNLVVDKAFTQRDTLVRNVIDYVIDDLGCTYTITPDLTNVDPALDGVENFLFNTKQGYCVQFASAAALILREYGIPTRYVEGYIASNLTKINSTTDFVYNGYVHDYEAHAWIEVYFDGLGWIQYECTPLYYDAMYGAKSTGTDRPDPVKPFEPVTEDETKPPVDPFGDEETESETETGEVDPEGADPRVLKTVGITMGIIVGLTIIIIIIATIVNKAREAEAHRQSMAYLALEPSYGEHTSEGDRRELALELADDVTTLLMLYGLSPKPGEFRDEYADRLTATLAATSDKQRRRDDGIFLPDLHVVMDALSAEEFGHGMTVPEMKLIAMLYLYLHRDVAKYIPSGSRFTLRYFKRKI